MWEGAERSTETKVSAAHSNQKVTHSGEKLVTRVLGKGVP